MSLKLSTCGHTPWTMFFGWFFVCESDWLKLLYRKENIPSRVNTLTVSHRYCLKFTIFSNPTSLAKEGFSNNNTTCTHFFSTNKWPVKASLNRSYPLRYVQQIYLIMVFRGFSLKNNFDRRVKRLVPLEKKRVRPNPILVKHAHHLSQNVTRKVYGFIASLGKFGATNGYFLPKFFCSYTITWEPSVISGT